MKEGRMSNYDYFYSLTSKSLKMNYASVKLQRELMMQRKHCQLIEQPFLYYSLSYYLNCRSSECFLEDEYVKKVEIIT